ncbi:MAG: DUF1028 domain-containing protein [Acidobacteria bacterium]|nr:DUF1028 domain-containing protein [Acidobacteriota bacterium]
MSLSVRTVLATAGLVSIAASAASAVAATSLSTSAPSSVTAVPGSESAARVERSKEFPGASVQRSQPFYSTFSICAIDPETGESGAAVTTRVPFVGRAVPWARAGVGAVATQAWTVVEYGSDGLDLLAEGMSPEDALEKLLADDAGRESRQIGMIDMQGRSAAHTGLKNGNWAGSRQGVNYTVQANIMVGPEVVDAVAEHLDSTAGSGMPLAERLILALEAGQKTGGDKRWGRLQSAAIRVADPNNPGRGGDHLSVSIDVGEHAHPVAELKRIYYKTQGALGHREFSEIAGSDVVELKRMLHALGYWCQEFEEFPTAPEFDADRGLMRTDPDAFQVKIDEYRKLARAFDDAYGIYDGEAMDAVDAFRAQHELDYSGNARGLVDARFVAALKDAYYTRPR